MHGEITNEITNKHNTYIHNETNDTHKEKHIYIDNNKEN